MSAFLNGKPLKAGSTLPTFFAIALDGWKQRLTVARMLGPVWLRASRLLGVALFLGGFLNSPARADASAPRTPVHASPSAPTAESPSRPAKLPVTSPGAAGSIIFTAPTVRAEPVMLGIDVLAAENFAPLVGKRVGLLTHPAGVNRFGVSTIDVLRRAPNVKLAALFGPEHGIYGDALAGENIPDSLDRRTGLPVYSLHGKNRKPTKAQLHSIDVLVVDLQDIGVRSYTFATCMRYAMDACFENGVEVIVLDRPNPLSGLKVDGPILEPELRSGVGGFCVPYVHGLTIGELARWAANTPGAMDISESARKHGKLLVIPMKGWKRSMRWPETGLKFVPTSQYIPDFAACVGCAMTGLGTEIGGFKSGIGTQYPFRGIFYNGRNVDQILHELQAMRLPGLSYRKVSAPKSTGLPGLGIYVEVNDWEDWQPTWLSFHLMRLACRWSSANPFVYAPENARQMFAKLVGSKEFCAALARDGGRVNIEGFIAKWREEDAIWLQNAKRFWLYE